MPVHSAQVTPMERLRASLLQGTQRLAQPAPGVPFRSLLEAASVDAPLEAERRVGPTAPAGAALPMAATLPMAAMLPVAAGLPVALRGGLRPALQADPAEYASGAEARRWGGSSCSAAALTAVARSAGRSVRVGDVVRALQAAGGITEARGLVSRPALVAVARRLGLAAEDRPLTYDQLAAATRGGPVLVDITSARFPAGHWLVVTGADAGGVSLVDSSGYHLSRMSRAEFQAAWGGRGIRVPSAPTSVVATPSQELAHA